MRKEMTDEEIKGIFAVNETILTGGHFVYAKKPDGWYHGWDYVNKDAIYKNPHAVGSLCKVIASRFLESGVEVVIGPTVGGVALAQHTVLGLNNCGNHAIAICADEEDVTEMKKTPIMEMKYGEEGTYGISIDSYGSTLFSLSANGLLAQVTYHEKVGTRRVLKRGYAPLVAGKKCLIVEDIINSGATVEKTIMPVQSGGGIVIGVGALCNRSGGKVTAKTLGVSELFSLLDLDLKMVKEEECEQCKQGIPVNTDLGKGKEFLQRTGRQQ